MNAPPVIGGAPTVDRVLRRLFLTVFLRGHSARGLRLNSAPRSVFEKLWMVIGIYLLFGAFAFVLITKPILALSAYLHATTLFFLGTFVAASAGSILFNPEEADILLHRPIAPSQLLRAKVRVLTQVSLWLAGAFNFFGLVAGAISRQGNWLYPLAHLVSVAAEALFGVSFVVVSYQLCLRWAGRERLDSLMTGAQVAIAIGSILGAQAIGPLMEYADKIKFNWDTWWIVALPPAWFAGMDDAIAGSHAAGSWLLAALGLGATILLVWLALGRLAADYASGLQQINETRERPARPAGGRRWVDIIIDHFPIPWWRRDPVARAAFLLAGAYLWRDRDVKLRVYPGIAPMIVMPIIVLWPRHEPHDAALALDPWLIIAASFYLGLAPLMGVGLLRYSQQWTAADLFRTVPLAGPASLCHGCRRAILVFLVAPLVVVFEVIVLFVAPKPSLLVATIPGVMALPVWAMFAELSGPNIPLSSPPEDAKNVGRGLMALVGVIPGAFLGLATIWAWSSGWFAWFLPVYTILCVVIYVALRRRVEGYRWSSLE